MSTESVQFIRNEEIYSRVLLKIKNTEKYLWIATAHIKDLYIEKGKRFVPFLEILSDLVNQGVLIRLIHAREPGPAFREDFDRYPNLIDGMERLLCPRVHFKTIVIDGTFAYLGSANLTGAGTGLKSVTKRNFENGIITTDDMLIEQIMNHFDSVWIGSFCDDCQRKQFCTDYNEMIL